MKAEERKRLHTNALLARLKRWWEAIKHGSRSTYIFYGVLILIVVGVLGWRWYSSYTRSVEAQLWYNLDTTIDLDGYQALATEHPDTLQGQIARMQEARILLGPEGVRQLGTGDAAKREAAIANIEKARDLYAGLVEAFEDEPVLRAEALRGAAHAEEALVGIPKKEGEGWRGSLDKAREYYLQLAALAPETPMGKEAARKAEDIQNNREKIEQFYVQLNEYLRKKG